MMLDLYQEYLGEKFIEQSVRDRLQKARYASVPSQRAARHLFDRAVSRARLRATLAYFTKRSRALPSWGELELQREALSRRYRGLEQVALSDVMGSVDRASDFDIDYYPKVAHICERWVSVASAILAGAVLLPVQLYKVGESYFVLQGNHRVSAAKVLGMCYIDAEVVEFYSCGQWRSQTNELVAA